MNTYINKAIKGFFIGYDFLLDENYRQGTTYEDFLAGNWVRLSAEQTAFKEAHPDATVREVMAMQLTPAREPTLEEVKEAKIREIDEYDKSSAVNEFYLNDVPVWLDKATRVGLRNSLTCERNAGRTESTMWFNGVAMKLNIEIAFKMLESLELYALECYNVTAQHKSNIRILNTIKEVEDYNYKNSYPNKLRL